MIKQAFKKKKEIQEALRFIQKATDCRPRLALILGSGFGDLSLKINSIYTVHSSNIPWYPVSSVQGHAGKLIFGYLQKDLTQTIPLLIFQGRVHFYETGSIEQVVFPVILAYLLGIKKLIVTNAAGGINSSFGVGDLMLIKQMLNLTFIQSNTFSRNFSQLHANYFDIKLQYKLLQCASQLRISLQQGTYCWLRGPSYETPAEIQMLKRIGVDAVGMSTVPEIITAYNLGIKTVGVSLISNMAAGISPTRLSHTEVTETANKANGQFSELIENLIFSI